MIKKTLYFGNPAYLRTRNEQLFIQNTETGEEKSVPIEDIGIVILDNQQITITQALLAKLLENNTAVINCDNAHLPTGLFMPLSSHTLQAARFRSQISASQPLCKQLWQQTIQSKISNQAALLSSLNIDIKNMLYWASEVKSGDPDNYEARAAAYHWRNLFGEDSSFRRERFGEPPNNLLNYAYTIIRAMVARALVGSGLLPTLGIHHRNQYNAFCLADDIMEPYRPFADALVWEISQNDAPIFKMDSTIKKQLLSIPTLDVEINGEVSPMMVAISKTTASLASCFEKKNRKIMYPSFSAR